MSSTLQTLENTSGETLRGIGLMTAATLLIPGLDAMAKILILDHAMPPAEISLARLVQQAVLVLPLLFWLRGRSAVRTAHLWLNLLRGVFLGLAGVSFFAALEYMPLADATAIFFVEPMIVTLLSALVLKETVGWRRILAVIVGFAGALIVIRPSFADFGAVALLPVAAAGLISVYLIMSRYLSRRDLPLTMHFWAGVGGSGFLAAAMAVGGPLGLDGFSLAVPREPVAWALLLGTGVVGTFAHLMFVQAYRLAPASVLAPFGYLEIISAVLLGLVLFGEFPDAPKWLGIAIIVVSGGYIFLRERQLSKPIVEPAVKP